jgi:hypothetical protein
MKLDSAAAIKADSIPANDPDHRLLDPQKYKNAGNAALYEKMFERRCRASRRQLSPVRGEEAARK